MEERLALGRSIFRAIFLLGIAGCASVNPYGLSEDEGAYLKNRSEYKGKSYLLYDFVSVETGRGRESCRRAIIGKRLRR